MATGRLDLTDARAKLDRAIELHAQLSEALVAWQSSGGVEAQVRPSHEFICYTGYAKVNAAPSINLQMRAGEVLHALRTALDYTAFQIYTAGGGTPDGEKAHTVQFPIVTDPAKWEATVKGRVSNAWPAAVAELRAVQQFAPPPKDPPSPLPPVEPLLSRLAKLGGTDKHRNLALFATGAWSQSAIGPELGEHDRLEIRLYLPGPLLPALGHKVAVSQTLVKPDYAPHPNDMYRWEYGLHFERPDPPELLFGFRANDETEISARELPGAIALVASILDRFDKWTAP
ncbi:hypothetical protein [Mycolicibacter hiberniae]|nr:hypothetical protein [Mycolicibacter hiberniae]MCV7084384.1 hypothetical protein [Mycolicibacter hiberniae]